MQPFAKRGRFKTSGKAVPRERVRLEEPKGVLSPPYLEPPLYQCAKVVVVRGFVPHAELEVFVNGASAVVVSDAGLGVPNGAVVALPAELRANDVVRALQRFGGADSALSPEVVVRDHREDYPAGLPQPAIDPVPLYECGSALAVNGLVPGSTVRATVDGAAVASFEAGAPWAATYVSPSFGLGQEVVAVASLCDDESPPSAPVTTQPRPSPLPTPTLDPAIAGAEIVVVRGLANGALFTISRNGTPEGTWATATAAVSVQVAPLTAGDVLTVSQRLCPGDPPSPEGTATVQPCSALGAPDVAPVQAGDTQVRLLDFVPGGRVKVFLNGVKVGDGSGPIVLLTRPVGLRDRVDVLQELGSCVSDWVRELTAACVAPPLAPDPSALRLFPVARAEYDGGTFELDGAQYPIRGTVYYPAERDGDDEPFNARLAEHGPAPIVFMAHGNHATYRDPGDVDNEACPPPPSGWIEIPNHEGYDYFQRQLAGMGIVAASVYSNPTNCSSGGPTNIRHRAELIDASIRHFHDLAAGGGTFGGRLDLDRVGLMGHSRGGDAVLAVPEIVNVPGARIRAVIALAPTHFGASSGRPRGFALLAIVPAADGDVVENSGAQFYDAAEPAPFKSQLYVDGANHNFFNRHWPMDDGAGVGPNRLARADQERILSAYGCAHFRAVLLGHDTAGFLTGLAVPGGVPAERIHVSAVLRGQETVDDHEQPNGIWRNTLEQPTTQLAGLTADEYEFRQVGSSLYNGTFYGDTTGMVAESRETSGEFRSQLDVPHNLVDREVWIRAGEVVAGAAVGATGFKLGLEDVRGLVAWVDSDDVGGLPRPYARVDGWEKTMPSTLRFRGACFRGKGKLALDRIVAIRLRLDRPAPRPLAFDDLQIVELP